VCKNLFKKRYSPEQNICICSTFEKDIKELNQTKAYEYLGTEAWERRVEVGILEAKISFGHRRAKNKIQAIASFAVPVLGYSFGIINWYQE